MRKFQDLSESEKEIARKACPPGVDPETKAFSFPGDIGHDDGVANFIREAFKERLKPKPVEPAASFHPSHWIDNGSEGRCWQCGSSGDQLKNPCKPKA